MPDRVRREYLEKLANYTKRNVIAYYSGWLSKPPTAGLDITDEDKNGFMMAVHNLDRTKGLDLILHTPGGNVAATQSLVDYLHQMFGNDMRAIVPQIAMSAGTMMACSCSSIMMAKHSNLGPIDPHLAGVPAYGIVEEFKRAVKEVKKDPASAAVWHAIIAQYRPAFLGQCQHAIKWSNAFVTEQLKNVMFDGDPDAATKAKAIVKKLSDYSGNRTHSLHIHMDACEKMGLKIERLESDSDLQDLVLTVHHCYMHALANTAAIKIIENHLGAAFVKRAVPKLEA
ncbi:MAG TPA: hypothetical protein VN706_15220 [Gemmatimonadaceae bacterium]|nr:hypothetical protein [Gemmatimonadaceae bacterium]